MLDYLTEKWRLFSQEQPDPDWLIQQRHDLEMASNKLNQERRLMQSLKTHSAWMLLENYFSNQIDVLRSRLERCGAEEIVTLQAELKATRRLKSFVDSYVEGDSI